MEMPLPLLKVKNLSVQFQLPNQVVEAVKSIDFQVNRGEIVGIVGESGSGKSVTALSIMRLLAKNSSISGNILFRNKSNKHIDLTQIKESEIRSYRGSRISMIFQDHSTSLNPVFKCGNQVVEVIQLHQQLHRAAAKKLTLQWFEKAKLEDPERIFSSYPHQISGGQKQRVMIAMAMCCQPDLLIADEPTTSLDVTVQKVILQLIKDLCQASNTAVLFISHDLDVVAEIADQVLVMQHGKIVETGSVKSIFQHPQHPYTKGLLACKPTIHQNFYRLPTLENLEQVIIKNDIQHSQTTISEYPPLLSVNALFTTFYQKSALGMIKKTVQAVENVSFKVEKGETLGLVGESGSGKTTLGRSILRLAAPTSGEIWYQQQDLMQLSASQLQPIRKDLQIIFQDPYASLNPRITIGNAIIEPMRFHKLGGGKERVVHLLEMVGLSADHLERFPHEFSGGQRQRICIARALALNPKFIVCDECVSSLDVSVQAQILNLLKDLQEQLKLSYLFISHDLSVMRFMSDRLMVMQQGKIVEAGETNSIFENPKTDYTKRLLEAIPDQKAIRKP